MPTRNVLRAPVSPRTPMLPSDALFWDAEEAMPGVRLSTRERTAHHPERAEGSLPIRRRD